ncbi:abscisic acid ABA receptor [Colletotrichum kahawae]|uniref:Abscisic acid ABA receptor n=1 Tax=Colletotrichum kahawae TaxID=34407 RepID=A0AAD9YJI1_COLKA|nr:abscisic acid ABA receptor [Colletotrichum kahawae]
MESSLISHLSKILTLSPPQSSYAASSLAGPLTSHTGTAYLFLSISSSFPRLQIHSYPAIHWARAYISNIPTTRLPNTSSTDDLGLSETLASLAVRACVFQDLDQVHRFLSVLPPIKASNPSPTCLLHGLSGTLYLLRLIRHWVPSSAPLVSLPIVLVSECLLTSPWSCPASGEGVLDGKLGILTQIVLTTPPLAPRLVEELAQLLRMQNYDGSWPSAEEFDKNRDKDLLQAKSQSKKTGETSFAHGIIGFILSLHSIRPFFPSLHEPIDKALTKASQFVVWDQKTEMSCRGGLWYGSLATAL